MVGSVGVPLGPAQSGLPLGPGFAGLAYGLGRPPYGQPMRERACFPHTISFRRPSCEPCGQTRAIPPFGNLDSITLAPAAAKGGGFPNEKTFASKTGDLPPPPVPSGLAECVEAALREVGTQEGTEAVTTESWLRAMDHHTAQLAGLLATLHPVVVHISGKKGP